MLKILFFTITHIYRKLIAERITILHQNSKHLPTPNAQQEAKTIKNIQSKLQRNNTTVTQADKGKTLVILLTKHVVVNSFPPTLFN